jgi:hypothetical protein
VFFPINRMNISLIQKVAKCSFDQACDISEVIEQVMPLSPEGMEVLQQPLSIQIRVARIVLGI